MEKATGISQWNCHSKKSFLIEALLLCLKGGFSMSKRIKLNLNIKFNGDKIECAKSPEECNKCKQKNKCENLDMFYYPFDNVEECMSMRKYRREKGAIKQK